MKKYAPTRKPRGSRAATHQLAVRAVVQILYATGCEYTLEGLKDKLREFFRDEADFERRAVASMSTVELVTALLEASPTLASIGLQIRLVNGTARLATTRVESKLLSTYLLDHSKRLPTHEAYSEAALEVLACVAFKQPVTQGEVDRLFGGVDKRYHMNLLREADMVEEFAGNDGRLRFATTRAFLTRFGFTHAGELQEALKAAEALPQQQESLMGFGVLESS